jgi:hypothetical protein
MESIMKCVRAEPAAAADGGPAVRRDPVAPSEVGGRSAPAAERGRSCDTRSRVALLDMIGGDDSAMVSCHLFPHGGGVTGNGGVSSTS